MRKAIVIFSLMLGLGIAFQASGAAPVREVSGEYTYYDDGRHSRIECMEAAAAQARIEALAREFGTLVAQSIMQSDRISGRGEANDFLALSSTEVKGEWLGDITEPVYDISLDKEGNFTVSCKVKGRAREISNETVDFEAAVLRNGTSIGNASTSFRNGDDMYLYFNPAADGFISVWLEDETRNVYELLPYPRDSKPSLRLSRGREYVFFSAQKGEGKYGPEEELTMTSDGDTEYNRLYVVYSPNEYSRPVTRKTGGLNTTTSADFSKWLMKSRQKDPKMGVKTMTLSIE